MRETWVQSLSQKDPLEKEMATHSSTLAWKIPWTEEPGSLQSMGHKESDTTERLHFHFQKTQEKKKHLMVTKGERGGRKNEFEMNRYILLPI